ncbi:lysylphosphatidylglycerol synthase domain-containing protein [uncultured Thiohalocapsa sp.]|uniref:lysylphosphatidylglycerol synthase domain-containing protein n=1 Tax=uncultured Thiohalocapsa sp. TaxID=768990 RepID=UPI0025E9EA2E|nr:lysylphosphatidylglycerol synthase domain-containing protein [uncultured Thiohalocapsa sp.]
MRLRSWSTLLVYLSLLFLVVWALQADYLRAYNIADPRALFASLGLVLAGFLLAAAAWWRLLALHGLPVSLRLSLASVGVTIFAKYIPGKVWLIVGRAGYLAERSAYRLAPLSLASLRAQLLTLWIGVPLGALTFMFVVDASWRELAWLAIGLWALLAWLLRFDVAGRSASWLQNRLRLEGPDIELRMSGLVRIAPWFLGVWVCWAAGFAMLAAAFTGGAPRLDDGLAFVLATTLGVVAVIAPGGLGVREGLLIALLVMLGRPAELAITLSVVARLWFLAGEAMLFFAGLVAAGRGARST